MTRPDSTTVSYKYDALGRRIQRSKSAGGSTNYIYDGGDVIKDINSDGSTVEYLNGLGIDDKLRQTSSSATLYFSQDHLGSTRALTDTSGNVVESVSYDSFGNGASTLSRYGFTGREWDAEANLYYYRNRWYDPQEGRFISADPIGLGGGMNMYAYVGNNPINHMDPLGLRQVRGDEFQDFPPDAVVRMKEREARENEGWWGMFFDDLLTGYYRKSWPCKSRNERFWESYNATNEILPGPFAPSLSARVPVPGTNTSIPVPGASIGLSSLTGHYLRKEVFAPSFLKWARGGFKGMRMGASEFTRLETGITVGAANVQNYILVNGAWEGGVAIGSAINATLSSGPCGCTH